MKPVTFEGTVEESGVLRFKNTMIVKDFLHSLRGNDVDVKIGKHYKRRSGQENAYYWSVVIPIVADEIGEEDTDCVHVWLQITVGHCKVVKGEKIPLGTSHLSTVDFEDYASKARMYASKFLNVYIPLPREGVSSTK